MAFRWLTTLPEKQIEVYDEIHEIKFAEDFNIFFPNINAIEGFISHQESTFLKSKLSQAPNELAGAVPVLIEIDENYRLLFSDADLKSYPGWFVKKSGKTSLKSVFARYPLEIKENPRLAIPATRANYIALTKGTRKFPWRMFIVANDKELLKNQLVYKLAEPSRVKDASWITPGKVVWDWWHAMTIEGVPFKSGVNTATYKHYIDFAAENNCQYIILDEGWSRPGKNIFLRLSQRSIWKKS